MFFGSMITEPIAAYRERGSSQIGEVRFDRLETHLIEMNEEVKRLRAGVEFDRDLEGEE